MDPALLSHQRHAGKIVPPRFGLASGSIRFVGLWIRRAFPSAGVRLRLIGRWPLNAVADNAFGDPD